MDAVATTSAHVGEQLPQQLTLAADSTAGSSGGAPEGATTLLHFSKCSSEIWNYLVDALAVLELFRFNFA